MSVVKIKDINYNYCIFILFVVDDELPLLFLLHLLTNKIKIFLFEKYFAIISRVSFENLAEKPTDSQLERKHIAAGISTLILNGWFLFLSK